MSNALEEIYTHEEAVEMVEHIFGCQNCTRYSSLEKYIVLKEQGFEEFSLAEYVTLCDEAVGIHRKFDSILALAGLDELVGQWDKESRLYSWVNEAIKEHTDL